MKTKKTSLQENLEAIAIIDFSYWHIRKMYEILNKRTPIEIAIDQSTGHEDEIYKVIISDIENIIANKKLIGADFSEDERMLAKLKEVYQTTNYKSTEK